MISVGSVLGGPEQMGAPIQDCIRAVSKAVFEICGHDGVPGVNTVFYVPGSLTAPDFDYPRTGKFSKREQLLMVQVPLRQEIVDAPPHEVVRHLLDALHAANAVAFDFFSQKGITFPLAEAESVVLRAEESLKKVGKL